MGLNFYGIKAEWIRLEYIKEQYKTASQPPFPDMTSFSVLHLRPICEVWRKQAVRSKNQLQNDTENLWKLLKKNLLDDKEIWKLIRLYESISHNQFIFYNQNHINLEFRNDNEKRIECKKCMCLNQFIFYNQNHINL